MLACSNCKSRLAGWDGERHLAAHGEKGCEQCLSPLSVEDAAADEAVVRELVATGSEVSFVETRKLRVVLAALDAARAQLAERDVIIDEALRLLEMRDHPAFTSLRHALRARVEEARK